MVSSRWRSEGGDYLGWRTSGLGEDIKEWTQVIIDSNELF